MPFLLWKMLQKQGLPKPAGTDWNRALGAAWEYYHSPRCRYSNRSGFCDGQKPQSNPHLRRLQHGRGVSHAALQIVPGSAAGSKWMRDDLYKRAASIRKNFHVVEGANHMSLYDLPKYVDEAVSVLAPFFLSSLEELAGGPHFPW
jgi:fermentation-respiration switch protein FrsA (DUF1100 family)